MMADGVELEAPELDVDEEAGRFKRAVAVAVVLVTLFGSIVAYVQAVESNKEDVAAREAAQEAIAGLGEQVNSSAELTSDLLIGSTIDAQRQQQALNAARVQAFSEDPDADVHLAATQRFAAVAEALATLAVIDPADPTTFDAERAQLSESPDEARLRQGVLADRANDHGDKADAYVAVLTVLAVALFLLGLSLTVQGRSRFVLAVPGVVIGVACVGWAAYISSGKVTQVSGAAIAAAAEGQRLQDAGELDAAIDAYDDAIRNSPDFAAAFARRSAAEFLAGSSQTGQTAFRSITSDEALERALSDLDRALELGASSDVGTVAEGGFLAYLDGDFERSIDLSEQAIELNERLAPVWFNLGAAHVALGNEDEAERAYRQGGRVVDDVPDPGTRSAVLAGARTDLSVLRDLLDDDELDDVEDLIEEVEASLATFELERTICTDDSACPEVDAGDVAVGDAAFSRSGALVEASIPVSGLANGDPVGAVWYFRTDDSLPFEQAFLSFEGVFVDDGSVDTFTLPVVDPPCPVAAEYLVRLYAGEEFIGEATGTIEPSPLATAFTSFADPIEGFEACQPEGFVVERSDVSSLDSFITFDSDESPFAISVNVTPGVVFPGLDTDEFLRGILAEFVPGAQLSAVQLQARDVDGLPIAIDGLLAVDEGSGTAVAAAVGPDTSSRIILLTGDVNEELLNEVVGLITFTGVAPAEA
jgi:tetratricopeptide (TPR) repeat protein